MARCGSRSLSQRLLAFALIAPVASVASASGPEAGEHDKAYTEAKGLYQQGKGKFETADYQGAIDLWTKAYTQLPNEARYGKIKVLLLYDLASAQEQAFRVDGEVAHLRQAKILLESFETNIPAIYTDAKEADRERTRVLDRIATLDRAIADAGEEEDPAVVPLATDPSGKQPSGDQPPTRDRKAKVFIGVGASLLGLGVASLGVFGAGLAIGQNANDISGLDPSDIEGRRDQFDRGRTGNAMAIGGGIAGAVLVGAGTALLVIGLRRKNKATAWAPLIGPGVAGVAFSARF